MLSAVSRTGDLVSFSLFDRIAVKNVPCEECEQCGEKFYTDEVAEQLEKMVDSAKKLMQEISVIDYSKVA